MRAVFSIHQRFCQTASSVLGCRRCVAGGVAGERLGWAAGLSISIQTAATTPIRIASRARALLTRNAGLPRKAGLRGMVTDDSVVDRLLAWALVDVAWMAEPVNVHPRIAFPDSRNRIRRANHG